MEARAKASGHQQPANNALPKWELKANWILRQYARIWCMGESPDTINFELAFKDVFTQFFLDHSRLAEEAEKCISSSHNEYYSYHGSFLDFSTEADKWEWIIENSMPYSLKSNILSSEKIRKILHIARTTEKLLKQEKFDPLLFVLQPWLHYEYYLRLPCLPPYGHEWVPEPADRKNE